MGSFVHDLVLKWQNGRKQRNIFQITLSGAFHDNIVTIVFQFFKADRLSYSFDQRVQKYILKSWSGDGSYNLLFDYPLLIETSTKKTGFF